MWVKEYTGQSAASADRLFDVLADAAAWSEWNAGVAGIEMDGPFEAGTNATMTLSDDTVLPFRLVGVEAGRGFEDETPVPDAGVVVRVLHQLTPMENGTQITYRCMAEGPDQAAAEVGAAVSADFPDVIAALAARAESVKS
ncbi:Polyketide cyclase / dehydrase and lipid transport [Mycobacterium sp. JS623]|uniref:SRPBCC family protein n=1 Tax=Mycobacterium sp. JS623 TaxID=212767 RepID=UPI0002A58E38|nr:SRPBCC family protein [Mycobacterium sp. JS623]AGB24745.1 Polyketide cyclase / dehydrase and lipid transport [Mycobacterium sp. JS623]